MENLTGRQKRLEIIKVSRSLRGGFNIPMAKRPFAKAKTVKEKQHRNRPKKNYKLSVQAAKKRKEETQTRTLPLFPNLAKLFRE